MRSFLVSLFSILLTVYCEHDISNSESLLFSHEDFIIPDVENSENEQASDKRNHKQISEDKDGITLPKSTNEYCSSFETCFECVRSAWYRCDWCHNLGCTDIGVKLCPHAASLKHSRQNLKRCPYIQHQGPILVPSGSRSHIVVELYAPDPILYDIDIICQLTIKNRQTHTKGLILNNSVYCYPVKFDSIEYSESVSGSFRLIWGGVDPYSNEVPVTVYNCGAKANSCEACRRLDPEFGCGWCDDLNICVPANKCYDMVDWALNRVTCNLDQKKMFIV